jgi:TonB family protein
MSSLVDASPAKSDGLWNFPQTVPARSTGSANSPLVPSVQSHDNGSLILSIFTTSICVHLLVVGFIGARLPEATPQARPLPSSPVTRMIEDVKLVSEKTLPPPPPKLDKIPPPPLPASAPSIDLPPLPQIAVVAAVPASVSVDFAIGVSGPVRLVSDFSQASGGIATVSSGPQEINDTHFGRNLLIPTVVYPPEALLHHVTGEVQVEFRTSTTGDIYDAKVRRGSGSETLDWTALENIRHGRWTGEAGYFTKTYEFILN